MGFEEDRDEDRFRGYESLSLDSTTTAYRIRDRVLVRRVRGNHVDRIHLTLDDLDQLASLIVGGRGE